MFLRFKELFHRQKITRGPDSEQLTIHKNLFFYLAITIVAALLINGINIGAKIIASSIASAFGEVHIRYYTPQPDFLKFVIFWSFSPEMLIPLVIVFIGLYWVVVHLRPNEATPTLRNRLMLSCLLAGLAARYIAIFLFAPKDPIYRSLMPTNAEVELRRIIAWAISSAFVYGIYSLFMRWPSKYRSKAAIVFFWICIIFYPLHAYVSIRPCCPKEWLEEPSYVARPVCYVCEENNHLSFER